MEFLWIAGSLIVIAAVLGWPRWIKAHAARRAEVGLHYAAPDGYATLSAGGGVVVLNKEVPFDTNLSLTAVDGADDSDIAPHISRLFAGQPFAMADMAEIAGHDGWRTLERADGEVFARLYVKRLGAVRAAVLMTTHPEQPDAGIDEAEALIKTVRLPHAPSQ